jgi:hypothetical protein
VEHLLSALAVAGVLALWLVDTDFLLVPRASSCDWMSVRVRMPPNFFLLLMIDIAAEHVDGAGNIRAFILLMGFVPMIGSWDLFKQDFTVYENATNPSQIKS